MATVEQPNLYDELLEMFVQAADADKILNYRLPAHRQQRLDLLLEQNRDGSLTPEDRIELEEFERLEHFGRMLKARIRQSHPA